MEDILTLQKLKDLPESVFASGIVENSPEGIYMTDSDLGRELIWVAKRGQIHDWCIYLHWADNGANYAEQFGDKLRNVENIKKLVPCESEAMEMYRF